MRSNEFLLESANRGMALEMSRTLTNYFLPVGYEIKITDHFVDQIYNPRNEDPIVMKEVAYVFARLLKYRIDEISEIPDQSAFAVQDRMTNIGMGFVKHTGEPNRIIALTIIRDVLRSRGQPVIVT